MRKASSGECQWWAGLRDVSGWGFLTKISQLEFSKVADEQVLRF